MITTKYLFILSKGRILYNLYVIQRVLVFIRILHIVQSQLIYVFSCQFWFKISNTKNTSQSLFCDHVTHKYVRKRDNLLTLPLSYDR